MRNFKKIIALVLALAMVLSTATVAFAAEASTTEEKAQVLYELGLFEGTSTTSFVPALELETTREQAMKVIATALAWTVTEGATSEFTDVADWAQAFVAKAVEMEVTNGIGGGLFGGTNTVSTRELTTWFDRALGVADAWEANSDLSSTDVLTRADLVDAIWTNLMKTPVGGTQTLIQTIVGTNDTLINIAVEAGLMEGARLEAKLSFESDKEVLKADGNDQVLVYFTLVDTITGEAYTDRDFEVAFSATVGTLAEDRVTAENGVATVLLTSEFLTEDVVSVITARVIESPREEDEIFVYETVATIVMSPNPGAFDDATIGASITAAESNEADRIILYFNKSINISDWLEDNGTFDVSEFTIEVRENSTSSTTGTPVAVRGLMPLVDYDGEAVPNAMQVLLDVETSPSNALTDNSNVFVSFTDMTKAIDVPSTATFHNTDVRKPTMLSVTNDGLRKLVITFSEAVIDETTFSAVSGGTEYPTGDKNAEAATNWQITKGTGVGALVSADTWGYNGSATIDVGVFDIAAGTDKRNIVTITLGQDIYGENLYFQPGVYSVQAANIGDWANLSDDKNDMQTQTLDFVIAEDTKIPVPTVTVQSPEQYRVDWNCDIASTLSANEVKLQKYNTTTAAWDDVDTAFTGAIADDNAQDLFMTDITGTSSTTIHLFEADLDWTKVYDTNANNKNYFNDSYRLVFAAGAVKNVANGKTNAEVVLPLGDAMLGPDVVSPVIENMIEDTDNGTYDVYMSEPVKLGAAANDEPATQSQKQQIVASAVIANDELANEAAAWDFIPVPTVEFIKDDNSTTVLGSVIGFTDSEDMVLEVDSDTALSAGGWTLVIRSISDDVGNTASTVTFPFTVTGATAVATDFDIAWIIADVDHDMVVENVDSQIFDWNAGFENTDGTYTALPSTFTAKAITAVTTGYEADAYDFVFVKFTKPVKTSGDYMNALKTSNYTIDGHVLPEGTQIVPNIENYDDFDAVVDSVTIKLPQGELEGVNAPHNINVSGYIESTDSEKLGSKGGEKVLPYSNYNYYVDSSATTKVVRPLADQLVIEYTTYTAVAHEVDEVKTAFEATITGGYTAALYATFVTEYEQAVVLVNALDASSLVKAQYAAYLADVKAVLAGKMVANNDFTVQEDGASSFFIEYDGTSVGIVPTAPYVKADGTSATRYAVTSNTVNGGAVEVTGTTGTGSLALGLLSNTTVDDSIVTVTVVDNFWGVKTTFTVEIDTVASGATIDSMVESTSTSAN